MENKTENKGINPIQNKMINKLLITGVILSILGLLIAFILFKNDEASKIFGVCLGIGLALLSLCTWIWFLKKGWTNKEGDLIKYLFGGMLLRLMLVAAVVAIALAVSAVDTITLISSMFIYIVIFQILEIRFITKLVPSKN